jgi:hypothetical protein
MIEVLMIVCVLGGIVLGIAIKPENKTDKKVVAMLHSENARYRHELEEARKRLEQYKIFGDESIDINESVISRIGISTHPGITNGYTIKNRTLTPEVEYVYTGRTIPSRAGCAADDGFSPGANKYIYDADGKEFKVTHCFVFVDAPSAS